MRNLIKRTVFTLFFITVFTANASAFVIGDIIVRGNQRVDNETVIASLGFKKGQNITRADLNNAIKNLHKSGFYEDIDLNRTGNTVIVEVKENPIINRVAFDGNDELGDDVLRAELSAKPRSIFIKSEVQKDVSRLMEIYKRSGRYSAVVEPKIIKRDQNRVDLVFEINEGDKTYIKEIDFAGNKEFSDWTLETKILSREYGWWKFLTTTDVYDPDRLKLDEEMLKDYYLNRGFADFEITAVNAELDTISDDKGFYVTFVIKEGEKYKFGNIDIEASIPDIKENDLKEELLTKEGKLYSVEMVRRSVLNLKGKLGKIGYGLVNITPIPKKNEKNKTVDIKYKIEEGPKTFINEINVVGNSRTFDYVIKRELMIDEQDTFNSESIKESKLNLIKLGYFDKVELNPKKSAKDPDKVDIEIEVKEKATGQISFGGGYNSVSGWFSEGSIKESNFMGKGQKLGFSAMFSDEQDKFTLSFTEPYFLDRDLTAGYDIYYQTKEYQNSLGYDVNEYGGNLRLGWKYTNNLSHSVNATVKETESVNFRDDVPDAVKDDAGKSSLYLVGHDIRYGKSKEEYDYKSGYLLSLGNDYAGFGGAEEFLRTEASAKYFRSFFDDKYKFTLSLNSGYIQELDDPISTTYKYFLGGFNLRGFASSGVGARDKTNELYSYGGLWRVYGSAQLNMPFFGLPKDYGLETFLFYDYGMLGEPGLSDMSNVNYDETLRTSWGVGVSWNSPFGKINLSWGYPIDKEEYDITDEFLFSVGTSF